MLNVSELREKSDDDLNKMISENKKALFNLRFQKKTGALSNTSEFSKHKKVIAKIKTILAERNISNMVQK